MAIIIAIGSGINLFEYIGKQQPNWWIWCTSNKIYACLVVFFGSNMFEGMLISTGAFELYFNGKHVKHITHCSKADCNSVFTIFFFKLSLLFLCSTHKDGSNHRYILLN